MYNAPKGPWINKQVLRNDCAQFPHLGDMHIAFAHRVFALHDISSARHLLRRRL